MWYMPSQDPYLYVVYAQSGFLFLFDICLVRFLICMWYMPSQDPYLYLPSQDLYLYLIYAQSRSLFVFGICPFQISDLYLVYTISFVCFGLYIY